MIRGRIEYDYQNLMASRVGTRHGVTDKELSGALRRTKTLAAELLDEIKARRSEPSPLDFTKLPFDKKTATRVKDLARKARREFETLVVFGIGGSALGAIALQTALCEPYSREKERLYVLDNVDPEQFAALLRAINPSRTLFNVITKSGSTVETISQFTIIRNLLGKKHRSNIILTTDPEKGYLREIARRDGYESFEIPPGVGGRFSVLTPVGLFPAAFLGIDIDALLAGARAMHRRCMNADIKQNPAFLNALLHYLLDTKKGKSISVMMPYSYRLKDIADWYRQLWAESLGKKFSLDGKVVHVGQTPVKALGVTDQHSQIQLYAEGPFDKVITFLAVRRFAEKVPISKPAPHEEFDYLTRHTLNDLINAEMLGTQFALTDARRPHCTITLPEINPHTVGQLLYMLEMQTAFAGKLYNINPFDQPGVEAGKFYAKVLLGKEGLEKERKKIREKMDNI